MIKQLFDFRWGLKYCKQPPLGIIKYWRQIAAQLEIWGNLRWTCSASGQLWLHSKRYSNFSKAKKTKSAMSQGKWVVRDTQHVTACPAKPERSKRNLQCRRLPSRSATTHNRVIGQKKGQEWNTQYKNKSKPNVIIYILEVKSSTCVSST